MSTQARIDMVGVGGRAVALQRTWSRCETSVRARKGTVGVRDERSGSEGHGDDHSSSMRGTESRQGVARGLCDWAAAASESSWRVLEYG